MPRARCPLTAQRAITAQSGALLASHVLRGHSEPLLGQRPSSNVLPALPANIARPSASQRQPAPARLATCAPVERGSLPLRAGSARPGSPARQGPSQQSHAVPPTARTPTKMTKARRPARRALRGTGARIRLSASALPPQLRSRSTAQPSSLGQAARLRGETRSRAPPGASTTSMAH